MRRRKLLCVSSAMIASLALSVGAAAWACTEFTSLAAPKSSPALSEVEVKGTGKVKPKEEATPVEVRWNDVTGPVVATATAKEIGAGVRATIPDVPSGIYFLIAVVDGKGIARTSIEVTSPAGTAAAPVDFRPTPDQLARNSGGTSSQLVGVALLGGGLVVLFGGALVVMSQRRKASAFTSPLRDDDLSA